MAVSKRTRFEVLRRDGHKCRYCGIGADASPLTVDHVVPVALGGGDDPSNLVAACGPCNSGKTSTSPDAATVAQVDEDVIRWHRASQAAIQRMASRTADREAYRQKFNDAWRTWDEKCAFLDDGWMGTVTNWHEDGLPIETLIESVDIAMGSRIPAYRVFRYLCGIVKRRLAELVADARDDFGQTSTASAAAFSCHHNDYNLLATVPVHPMAGWPHTREVECGLDDAQFLTYVRDPMRLLEAVVDGFRETTPGDLSAAQVNANRWVA